LIHHAAAQIKTPVKCQDGRYQSQQNPEGLSKPTEAATMRLREPRQPFVGKNDRRDQPFDGEPSRQLIAVDNYAAGNAHEENIQACFRSHPQVNLE